MNSVIKSLNKFKDFRLAIVALGLIVAFGLVLTHESSNKSSEPCGPYRTDRNLTVGGSKFKAEVVTTRAEQATGLGDRLCIEPDQVMLFIFDKPGQYAIWMKNMKFSIDILWATPKGEVVGIERGVTPSTYPDSFANKEKNAQYIIEMKAGRSTELKIDLGDKVKLQ